MSARFKVYRITKLGAQFAYFYPTPENEGNRAQRVLFDGSRREAAWVPPKVYRLYPARGDWDVAPYLSLDALTITQQASDCLGDHVHHNGVELLPLRVEGEQYWVVNILDVVNCLDVGNCVFPPDRPWAIQRYSFFPRRFTRSLFKLPEHCTGAPYVAEDAERPGWSFKAAFEANGLRGIGFEQVWEGD